MSHAKDGDTVKVHYTGRLENGEVFANSKDGEPLEFTIGSGEFITGLEKGIIGMEVREAKTIAVPPEKAYGPRSKELIVKIRKADLPEQISLAIGLQLRLQRPDGSHIDLLITDMDEDTVTLDANHPLAGNTLVFNVELVEIA
jgi:FKBP-type peptidyl-prolyl cis-trans isomerase 2